MPPARSRFLAVAIATAGLGIGLAGCGSGTSEATPTEEAMPPGPIGEAIASNIGSGATDYGAPRAAFVDCGKMVCFIAYNADTPVYDTEGELIDGSRPIFEAAFTEYPNALVMVSISGQTDSVGGKSSVDTVMTIQCTPGANKQIDWSVVDAGGVKTLCDYAPKVNFN